MAEFALGALGPAIEIVKLVSKPIIRQFNYLCCFTSNISGLEDEAKKLADALSVLEGEVQVGRDNVLEPVPQVETWLTKSKKMKDEISGILTEASNVESGCWSKLGARSLSRRAKKTTESTEELIGEKPPATFLPRTKAAREGVQLGKTFECESRNKIEEEIMIALRGGDEKNTIGICGMGGLGKTTMAKKLMNRALKENVFGEVVIATVSQNVDISKIQDEIGGQLGLDKLKEETSQSGRVQLLLSRLSDTKGTTLLVLDDVWETPPLESIGIPRDSKWCTILFTSRNRDVLHDMDVGKIFGMKVLSEDEAWSFFRERAGACADDRELNPTAEEVAKQCGRLPINLAAVGAALRDQRNVAIWKNTLRELKKSVPDNVRYDKNNYNPLKLSYEYLDSKETQSIFLLCCLFPEDADIPLDYLTYFCMGLRKFEDGITNMEDARNKMCALTEFLKDRSLLLESDVEDCVRMHDVVRDVCTLIAKEEGYIGKDGGRWISFSHLVRERNEFLSVSRCLNLNLLFLDSMYDNSKRRRLLVWDDDSLGFKFDDAFVEGMIELNVLCIQNYNSLTTLPHPTQSLGNLNTLILDSCEKLETISVVGGLVNLEILICRNCPSIRELPSEMKGLYRLKVLDITGCGNLQSIGRGIISNLVGLEELKMYRSFNGWEAEESEERENASIKELEDLTNLECLEIDIRDRSLLAENMPLLSKKIVRFRMTTDSQYIPSKFSKAMSLSLERETRFGDWIEMRFLRDTECLRLSGDGAKILDLARIHQNIRWLELNECESMKHVVRTSGGATVFPLIEHLKLESLPKLQEICDAPISSTSFQNLKELILNRLRALTQFWKSSSLCQNNNVPHFSNLSSIYISNCDSVRNLGQLSMAANDCLPQLEQLYIEECSMMEQVFLWNDDQEAGGNKTGIESQQKRHEMIKVIEEEQQQQERILLFPNLKFLLLKDLPKLVSFCDSKCEVQLPLLRNVEIRECPNMNNFSLGLVAAPNVEAFRTDLTTYVGVGVNVAFDSMKELVIGWNENPLNDDKISVSLFNGLENLQFLGMGSMSLFSCSVVGNLVNLRVLKISYCFEIVKVIENEEDDEKVVLSGGEIRRVVFPKLEVLALDCLTKLVRFCEWKCEVELPLLREVVIISCPNMESLSMGFVAAPNLKIVKIDKEEIDATEDLNVAVQQHYIADPKKILFGNRILEIPSLLFNRLEVLVIYEYKGIVSFFSPSAIGNLVNLKTLDIGRCDEIVKLIEDEEEKEDGKVVSGGEIRTLVFPKLEELDLGWLPKLEIFCEWKCDVELPSLTKLEIEKCPNMKKFSLGLVATPNLEIVKIDGHKEIDATKDLNVAVQQHYLARLEKGE